jgi:hypothetical protein
MRLPSYCPFEGDGLFLATFNTIHACPFVISPSDPFPIRATDLPERPDSQTVASADRQASQFMPPSPQRSLGDPILRIRVQPSTQWREVIKRYMWLARTPSLSYPVGKPDRIPTSSRGCQCTRPLVTLAEMRFYAYNQTNDARWRGLLSGHAIV